ncbi:DNA-binding TFAR19-related protein [Auriculariales sp. MPI-PUGE-AT-0066]|nr:DNA-binding TFAR19-related protein [Auriculariales sp. MPI-PUGE-AT-0066]
MDDPELQAIRAARLAQLQAQAGQGSSSRQMDGDDEPGPAQATAAKQQADRADQMRRDILATVLDSAARERLARISLVSPQRSAQVEAILVRMAQSGQLRGKVTEEALIGLLEQAENAQAKAQPKKGTIIYQRRRDDFEDEDDFDL